MAPDGDQRDGGDRPVRRRAGSASRQRRQRARMRARARLRIAGRALQRDAVRFASQPGADLASPVVSAVVHPPRARIVGVRRAHQAADHRAAAGHHRADDGRGRAGPAVALADRRAPCSAARSPPAAPTPSTCTSTATSTALMERTKNRPLVTGAHHAPRRPHLRHRPRGRGLRLPLGHGQPAQRRAGRRRLPLLRVRVHALAQAHVRASNIVIGGAAGAVPVLIGWSGGHRHASTGPRSCCSRSSSTGPRRTSGPWPSATGTTTPPPTCRCSRRW